MHTSNLKFYEFYTYKVLLKGIGSEIQNNSAFRWIKRDEKKGRELKLKNYSYVTFQDEQVTKLYYIDNEMRKFQINS